jgi:hypothetical protein
VLAGRRQPADPIEESDVAAIAAAKGLYAAATRLNANAFKDRPELASDLSLGRRASAARVAALAAAGKGNDDQSPNDAHRAELRKQAITWLSADLDAWENLASTGKPEVRAFLLPVLERWMQDPAFASVRDKEAISRLPEPDRKVCRVLWARVDILVAEAAFAKQPPT